MASRTQIRLQQVTGSFDNLKTEAQQYVTPAAVTALTGSDLQDVLGAMAASLNRIHGAASDEPFNNTAGVIRSQNNAAAAIKLHADQGTSQTIQLLNDEGTSSSAIDLTATAGGFSVDGVQASNITVASAGAADDLTISVTGATDSSLILSSAGTAADALQISTSAGGMDITVNGAAAGEDLDITADSSINITSSENVADAIVINASAGGVDITAAGAAGEDIDISNTAGSVNISAGEAVATAIVIDATGNSGIDITAGNAANDANANLDIIAMNNLTIDTQGTDNGDGVNITLGSDDANTALRIKNDSDSEKFKVDALGDVTVGRNLTVTGDLDVNGTTTTIDTVNLSVQDSIIALGVSGSDGGYSNVGDRGILFPRGADSSIVAGLWWDNTQFNLAKTLTGPTSASFENVTTSNWAQLKVGNLLPGEDDTYDLGSTSLAWQDLHLEGDVLMTDAGKVETAAGDITVSSAAAKVVIDAETDIELNAKGNNIFIKKDSSDVLEVTSMDPGSGKLIGVVSASQGNLALVSAAGSGEIHFAQGPFTETSATIDIVHNASRKVQFKMGTLSDARVRLELDDQNAASCVHDLSGSLLLDDGATAGEIRFQEAGTGNNYMGFKAPDDVTANKVFTLPDGHPNANNSALVSSTAGVLSYASIPSISKGIYILTASHASTVSFRTSDDNDQHVSHSDSITGLSQSDTQGKDLDVFVNGQLLMSGSQDDVGNGSADYMIDGTIDIAFGFALEDEDIVQIIKRGNA